MRYVIAADGDLARLLALYHVDSAHALVERMVSEGDAANGSVLVDEQGRLCLVDSEPAAVERAYATASELRDLYVHYGVEPGDLAALRRRMLFEGGWRADEVGIDGDRLFTAVPAERRQD